MAATITLKLEQPKIYPNSEKGKLFGLRSEAILGGQQRLDSFDQSFMSLHLNYRSVKRRIVAIKKGSTE